MKETILIGRGHQFTTMPRHKWEQHLTAAPAHFEEALGFMSEEHHRVRYFVVRELPKVGKPLSPEFIARKLNLPLSRVNSILDELEKNLTFLFRNEQGDVAWAYPVTVDKTPHQATFSTGEKLYAA